MTELHPRAAPRYTEEGVSWPHQEAQSKTRLNLYNSRASFSQERAGPCLNIQQSINCLVCDWQRLGVTITYDLMLTISLSLVFIPELLLLRITILISTEQSKTK